MAWQQYGNLFYGMRRQGTNVRHGLVRCIEPNGSITDASYKDNALHGIWRKVDKDGVRMQILENGRPRAFLEMKFEGSRLVQKKRED